MNSGTTPHQRPAAAMAGRGWAASLLPLCLAIAIAAGLPSTVAAKDMRTGQVGGPGGAKFTDRCELGGVLVGFRYSAGKALNTVQLICMTVSPQMTLIGQTYTLNNWGTPAGNNGAFSPFAARGDETCPPNSAITAINVWIDRFNIVHKFTATCGALTGGVTGELASRPEGGEASYEKGVTCTDRYPFAVGMTGGYGALIDRLGLLCEDVAKRFQTAPVQTPTEKPANNIPAMEIDNPAGKGGGGGSTAATDTTIYDQPGGTDQAYLTAGDAVTITNCDGDGWCEISQPQRGFVWGEDLNH